MGLLDDAIREHLELKRRRGADAGELSRAESEALGPVRRAPDGQPDLPRMRLRLRRAGGDQTPPPPPPPAFDEHDPPTAPHERPPAAYEPPAPPPRQPPPPAEPAGEDLLEETPEFLEETPDHDRLW